MEQPLQAPSSVPYMHMQELSAVQVPLEPANICEAIAVLIDQNKLSMAEEMADLAQILHPSEELVLAVSALVAETTQNWSKALALLTRLQEVQGDKVRAETLRHEIRVLRCMGAFDQAFNRADVALKKFPADETLCKELESLRSLFSV